MEQMVICMNESLRDQFDRDISPDRLYRHRYTSSSLLTSTCHNHSKYKKKTNFKCARVCIFSNAVQSPKHGQGDHKEERESSVFVFLHQWCTTFLSHPTDSLLSLHTHTWTSTVPLATCSTFTALQWLSNNGTIQLCVLHTHRVYTQVSLQH